MPHESNQLYAQTDLVLLYIRRGRAQERENAGAWRLIRSINIRSDQTEDASCTREHVPSFIDVLMVLMLPLDLSPHYLSLLACLFLFPGPPLFLFFFTHPFLLGFLLRSTFGRYSSCRLHSVAD